MHAIPFTRTLKEGVFSVISIKSWTPNKHVNSHLTSVPGINYSLALTFGDCESGKNTLLFVRPTFRINCY